MKTPTFNNPILRGSYPDPSICRVGEDYYLVNSSFEYFPGLPIHHSRDLVNWELIGYGLHREEQASGVVNLLDVPSDGGIHAPTLRCHEGTFYLITTNVYAPRDPALPTQFVNFILTAQDPRGPWSMPHVLAGAPGIDPDIFFAPDGTVWYTGTHSPETPHFDGEGEIWLQQIDLTGWRLIGERHYLWRGACGGVWTEGPHLYYRDGRYYLMVAEGGTGLNHAVMIAVSDDIRGPYRSNSRNPILTSRHLSYDFWVNSVGHADLVDLPDGRTMMVALGVRGEVGRASNMGRETHLIPVQWEREPFEWQEVKHLWPVAAPETGRVERETPLPFPNTPQIVTPGWRDDFEAADLGLAWNFRRVPRADTVSLTANPGHLRLKAAPQVISERERCSLIGVRQAETNFDFSAMMAFKPPADNVEAGLCLVQKDNNHIRLTVSRQGEIHLLKLTLAQRGLAPNVVAEEHLSDYEGQIKLRVRAAEGRYYTSYAAGNSEVWQPLAHTAGNLILSRGFTGAYLSLYASSNGQDVQAHADFDWVQCDY